MPISEQHEKRRGRNVTLGLVLAALVVLFFVVTIVKIGAS